MADRMKTSNSPDRKFELTIGEDNWVITTHQDHTRRVANVTIEIKDQELDHQAVRAKLEKASDLKQVILNACGDNALITSDNMPPTGNATLLPRVNVFSGSFPVNIDLADTLSPKLIEKFAATEVACEQPKRSAGAAI